MQDTKQLLSLKAAASDVSTSQRLSSWQDTVPPCTNSSVNGSCIMCHEDIPVSQCGTFRSLGGPIGNFLCNWRFIECRDGRVVKVDMPNRVSSC